MYLINFRSRLRPGSKASAEFPDVGGAYVSCYIQFKDYDAAEKLAKLLIRERGWIPEKMTGAWVIRKSKLKKKKEKQFYAEALRYGYSLVFNMWPKGAEDAEVDYD
jgi:hypothetical protein